MDQEQLVTQAISGDKQAFSVLYRLWVGKIYAYCVVRIGQRHEAEDITEKVFIKVYKSIKNFKQQSSFATWIYAITRNELNDYYRKKNLRPLIVDNIDNIKDEQHQQQSERQYQQNVTKINHILDQLPDDYAQVLKLRFIQNMTIKEAADIIGITESNVKVRQLRAIKKAQQLFS